MCALGVLHAPSALPLIGLAASIVTGGAAEWRMRGAQWAAFHAYSRMPEAVPKDPVKR